MFVLSKIILIVTDLGVILLALLCVGATLLWTRWRSLGRWVTGLAALSALIIGTLPIGSWMIERLENRFQPVKELPELITGIITLSGSFNQYVTAARGQPSLGSNAERLTEFIALARRYPTVRLVFSGGSGLLTRQDIKEADAARLFFAQMSLDLTRVVFENQSRNTYENAVLTHAIVQPKEGEIWVLITSAMHMPRAVGTFRKAGWSVIPYPVDYNTEGIGKFWLGFNLRNGLNSIGAGTREWVSLVAYRVLGRMDSLFPAPNRGRVYGEAEGGEGDVSGDVPPKGQLASR